jgi:hypothetical protein
MVGGSERLKFDGRKRRMTLMSILARAIALSGIANLASFSNTLTGMHTK